MKTISIVIVNYKVKHFLKQCLYSIQKANLYEEIDVWVVDNNSQDGSVEMVQQFFPNVHLIINKENIGFSRANNQAINQIETAYTLILNPDTVLSEDTISVCKREMESDDKIGMIGVRMIDGTGAYLAESKRGFPTPSSSFYKLSGWYKFFPKSAYFNHYYLGHLKEFDRNEVEILTGAFMFSRTSILHQVNGFDEDFFMYGEDIDLSSKIIQSGYKIIYLPETSIIHFKGESTKKDSTAYIKHFYNAMLIFTRKHYKGSKASVFTLMLKLGVYLRAFLGFINQVVLKRAALLIDLIIAFFSLELISSIWATYYYNDSNYYSNTSIHYNNLVYSLFWCLSLYIIGHYGRKFKLGRLAIGILIGSGMIFILYALLGSAYNPSRAIIILGMLSFGILMIIKNAFINFFDTGKIILSKKEVHKALIVGDESEIESIKSNLLKNTRNIAYIGFIQVSDEESIHSLGTLSEINEIVRTYDIDEVIFSLTNSKISDIMSIMTQLGNKINIKLTGGDHLNIIGSSSKNLSGEVYMMDLHYNIKTLEYSRQKRVFDIISSLITILISPIIIIRNRDIKFLDLLRVFIGKMTFVGYIQTDSESDSLPKIKPCLIDLSYRLPNFNKTQNTIHNTNLQYAKNYKVRFDFLVFKKLFH